MAPIYLSLFGLLLAQLASAQTQGSSKPPSKVWTSHIRTLGENCPPATAAVASDFNSVTVTWDLKAHKRPFLSLGRSGESKIDCAVNFVLRVPDYNISRSAFMLETSAETKAELGAGVKAEVVSQVGHSLHILPSVAPPLSIKGPFKDTLRQHANLTAAPNPPSDYVMRIAFTSLPGREAPVQQTCINSNGGMNSHYDEPDVLGVEITVLESLTLSGAAGATGAIGTGDKYARTLSLYWVENC